MVGKNLNKIFLSASIPLEDRDKIFYVTADVIAIRDSVRALATVVVPNAILVWGGHPAITPLIRFVLEQMHVDLKRHVMLYQSEFFKAHFPPENFDFEDIILVPAEENRDKSLIKMRHTMIAENDFKAGIFIGGMEGVFEEYKIFKKYHPDAMTLPIGSTGAAARLLFDEIKPKPSSELISNFAYMNLFQETLKGYL